MVLMFNMILILKENNLDIDRIKLKTNKRCIKLIYDMDGILLIGLTFKISEYQKIYHNNSILIELLNEKQLKAFIRIDNHLLSLIENYKPFIVKDKYLKIKNYVGNNGNNNIQPIIVTINNLKRFNEQYRAHIYTV
jgi:hypothetical protein